MAVTQLISRALLAGATAGAMLVPATANAEPAQDAPLTFLKLEVSHGEGWADTRRALLTCDPAGGTHSNADEACSALEEVDGQFGELRNEPNRMCTLIYRPVTVTAEGAWEGERVDYEETFPNACVLKAYMGSVFEF